MILVLHLIVIVFRLVIISSASNSSQEETPLTFLKFFNVGSKKCMDDLGCFEITDDFFHILHRPINLLPQDRMIIGTQFLLYNKESPIEQYELKHNDIESMEEFNSTHQTIFIVHGLFESKHDKWMKDMKNNLLLYDDYNVIIVDWSKGNGLPYSQAASNTRVVGAEIALLIKSLIKHKNLDPMKVHIIGHSLGSHVAGYAGQILKKLGRITGLDPAFLYFEFMPPNVRLDPTDADFVDVIHTDSGGALFIAIGLKEECGHIDFYPNNGRNQPGCTHAVIHSIFNDGLIYALKRFVYCSHRRAIDFFLHSINSRRVLPVAFECDSWSNFEEGKCADCSNGKCSLMGLKADKYKPYKNDSKSVKMYLATSGVKPYWQYTFQLTVKLKETKSITNGNEFINLRIEGSKNITSVVFSAKLLKDINPYTHLVRLIKPLGEIKEVIITWTNDNLNSLDSLVIYLEHIIIKPMNSDDEKVQMKLTKTFCSRGKKAIGGNVSAKLELC